MPRHSLRVFGASAAAAAAAAYSSSSFSRRQRLPVPRGLGTRGIDFGGPFGGPLGGLQKGPCSCAGIDKQKYLEKKCKRDVYHKSTFGFQYVDKTEGEGKALKPGDFAWVEFEGRNAGTGQLFESTEQQSFLLSLLLRPFSRDSPRQGGPRLVRVKEIGDEEIAQETKAPEIKNKERNTAGNDETQQQEAEGEGVIEGIARGICGMKRGGKRELILPPQMAYKHICNEVLIYEVRVVWLGESLPPRTFWGRARHAMDSLNKEETQTDRR